MNARWRHLGRWGPLVLAFAAGACTGRQPRSPTTDPDEEPSGYRASGTEPFWTTVVTDSIVRYHELGKDEMVLDSVVVAREGDVRRITAFGSSGTNLELRLTPGPCRDAMADVVFEFAATVVVRGAGGSDTLRGCAKRGVAPAGEGRRPDG